MMRRLLLFAVAALVAGAAGGVAATAMHGASPDQPTREAATSTAPIIRTTLLATEPVDGTVSSVSSWSVGLPAGATPSDLASAEQARSAAASQVASSSAGLTTASRVRSIMLAADRAAVASATGTQAVAAARRQQRLDEAQQALAVSQARSALDAAMGARTSAEATLADRLRVETAGGSTFTMLPAAGASIGRGDVLYALDGRPTALFIGSTPAYRALRERDTGPDVAELQANLAALDIASGLRTDGVFDRATTAAVRTWQGRLHVPETGVVLLGDVVFVPGAAHVSSVHAVAGAGGAPGAAVIDLSSVDQVVNVPLDPGLAVSVHAGDPARIHLPDGSVVDGRIQTVASVATPVTQPPGGNGVGPQSAVAATASPVDETQLAGLDGAHITLDLTTATATDALAVPVTALVVLADGSFGVELADGAPGHFVRVTPGIYDRTLVQVTGDGIAEGGHVVVPAP